MTKITLVLIVLIVFLLVVIFVLFGLKGKPAEEPNAISVNLEGTISFTERYVGRRGPP